jgi:hypothetical protein
MSQTENSRTRDRRVQGAIKAAMDVAARLGRDAPSPKTLRWAAGELQKASAGLSTLADDFSTFQDRGVS